MSDDRLAYALTDAKRIGEGVHGAVYALANGREVIKVYCDNNESKMETARREFARLDNAVSAFRDIARVQSPVPLELFRHTAAIRMSRCYGTSIFTYLAEHRQWNDEHGDMIQLLSDGIGAYTERCGEGVPDCAPCNLLYDAHEGILSFVDFTTAGRRQRVDQNKQAVVFSVECLISDMLYDFVTPPGVKIIRAWPTISFVILASCSRALAAELSQTKSRSLRWLIKLLHKYSGTQRVMRKRFWYQMLALPLSVVLRFLLRRVDKNVLRDGQPDRVILNPSVITAE